MGYNLVDRLLANERYNEIAPLTELVGSAASQSRNIPVATRTRERLAFVQKICNEFAKLKPAFETLASQPGDGAANLAVGKFYAIQRDDWEKALPMLSKGADKALADLAKRDLANPSNGPAQSELGGAWWEAGEKQVALTKTRMQSHAATWYAKAVPNLTGLSRVLAEKRVAAGKVAPGGPLAVGSSGHLVDLLKLVDVGKDSR